jgi:transcriptional regulator with XRE-family HTH domain
MKRLGGGEAQSRPRGVLPPGSERVGAVEAGQPGVAITAVDARASLLTPPGGCPVCHGPVPPSKGTKPRKYCSPACLVRAQRLRNRGLLDGVVADSGAPRRRGSWHTCPECRSRVWVRPSEEAQWRTCGKRTCAAARRRSPLLPWNPLQQRLVERMAESSLTLQDVATATGLSRATIRKWYQIHGRYLTSTSLGKLAGYLGMAYESALEAAGGKTGEEEMARTGRLTIATARPAPGTPRFREARIKAGAAMQGRPHSEAWRAKIRAGIIAAGAPAYGAAKLRTVQATPEGAAQQRLWIRLRWHPHPRRAEVIAWAREVSARLGRPDAEILEAWKPYLTERGIWVLGGRPPAERRHYLVAALVERWPAGTRGLWPMIAWWIGEAEDSAIGAEEVAKWWRTHEKHCTRSAMLSHTDAWTAGVDRVPHLSRRDARRLVHDVAALKDSGYEAFFAAYLPPRNTHVMG